MQKVSKCACYASISHDTFIFHQRVNCVPASVGRVVLLNLGQYRKTREVNMTRNHKTAALGEGSLNKQD